MAVYLVDLAPGRAQRTTVLHRYIHLLITQEAARSHGACDCEQLINSQLSGAAFCLKRGPLDLGIKRGAQMVLIYH